MQGCCVCRNIAGLKGTYKEQPYGEVEGQLIKIALGEVSSQHKKEIFLQLFPETTPSRTQEESMLVEVFKM